MQETLHTYILFQTKRYQRTKNDRPRTGIAGCLKVSHYTDNRRINSIIPLSGPTTLITRIFSVEQMFSRIFSHYDVIFRIVIVR